MLSLPELGAFIDTHLTRSAFRLERLDVYDSKSDAEQLARYVAGDPAPGRDAFRPWLDRLHRERAAGITRQRVHVLTRPLSPYNRFECEWGYTVVGTAGEDIRVLDHTGHGVPPFVPARDFWLIDDTHVIDMRYDPAGKFTGAVVLDPGETPRYRAARDLLVHHAEPFGSWWAAHPEEHRQSWMTSAA